MMVNHISRRNGGGDKFTATGGVDYTPQVPPQRYVCGHA